MRNLCVFLLTFWVSISFSQNFEKQWKGFFSYVSIKAISHGNDKIYVGSENAIYTYDLSTQEINTFSTIQGLSGETISALHYSIDYGALFIGYETGLIDVVIDGEENILKVVDILDKPTISPNRKRINQFYEHDGSLFIATEYGISVYDIARLEFGDTYFIGALGTQINVTQTTILPPYIYASSMEEGLKRALIDSDNLIDYEEWETIATGPMVGVQSLGDDIYIARDYSVARIINGGSVAVATYVNTIRDFTSDGQILTVTTRDDIYAYDDNITLIATASILPALEDRFQSGISFGQNFYVGTFENGLYKIPFATSSFNQILPNGPILNSPFAIDASPGQLWVSFGDIDVNFDPSPFNYRGISLLQEENWVNIDKGQLFGASDLVNVKINPLNSNEVFFSSFQEGLLKVVDQTPQILYDETNSILDPLENDPDGAIRIFGAQFDRDNNLWFVQSLTKEGLLRLTPNGQFQKFDISTIIDSENESGLNKVAISREGYVFIATSENGLVGYNPSENKFAKIGSEIGNGNLPTTNVRALAFDASNRLWIGTLKGLRVLFNVGGFFGETVVDAQEIIILEDGVPQELLYEQSITDIEVDGSNNKWIATATSGVFYLSSNGQETLLRFTKDNSPLPSNNVQDITIDNATGRVYFAAINGLVAFEGTSTAPRDNLENVYAFPNPVRPNFTGSVTIDGLTADANVKITDIEGNLVFETTSQGGSVLWDTTAFGKYKVASGVYMVLITSEDQLETKVTKIMVIR
ncbi:MAG: T9SS type A sorting domain-containing protein [Flavobacteriaceae bacterium]|nr:T9SS type A sorting domain-containing protein [Flavobacteriaceae bacterium]